MIIKGLRASSAGDLTSKFEQPSEQVISSKVSLSDVSSILGYPNFYQAKITSDDLRKTVLEKAKMLRDSDYSSVYILTSPMLIDQSCLLAERQDRANLSKPRTSLLANPGQKTLLALTRL